MAIIRSNWVLQPQIVMVWQQLRSVCLVAIGWLSARSIHLLMTAVPDLSRVAVVALIGSTLSAVIFMAQSVPNLSVTWMVLLKHQVNWNIVCWAMQDLPWRNILSYDNPAEDLMSIWLDVMSRPRLSIRATWISNWFHDQFRRAFRLKLEAHPRWTRDFSRVNWEEFVCCQWELIILSARNRDVLMNDQFSHKWWSTFKSAVFCSPSSLPRLVGFGGLMCARCIKLRDDLNSVIC